MPVRSSPPRFPESEMRVMSRLAPNPVVSPVVRPSSARRRGASRRARYGFAAAGTITGVVLSVFTVVAAGSGPHPSTCPGTVEVGPGAAAADNREANVLLSDPGAVNQRVLALPAPLPPGSYAVNAVSWDGYSGRAAISQPAELWYVEMLDHDGTMLVRTSHTTEDIPDYVEAATWAGGLGTISWTGADAVAVRVAHGGIGRPTPNSVVPICVGFEAVTDQSTTTVPTTLPTTTTTTPPTTLSSSPSTTAPAPPTTVSPTTTEPVDVLGLVVQRPPEAQVAAPQPVQPRFAG